MVSKRLLWIVFLLPFQVGVRGWRHAWHSPGHGFESHTATSQHNTPHQVPHQHGGHRFTPESQNNTVVVAQKGGIAKINCDMFFSGDEMVTWTKRDAEQLLSVGRQLYSSKTPRYSVTHSRHRKMWQLSVRDVKTSDAGLYECQLVAHPPISLFFTLEVVEARAMIHGGPEVYVHTGARIRLRCDVRSATEPPTFIFWYHNESMVNYNHRRPIQVVHETYGSSLIISNISWHDAGVYNCEPANATPANLTLHVLEGEKHAALYKSLKENGKQDGTPALGNCTPTPLITPLSTPLCLVGVGLWFRLTLISTVTLS